jgi:hypothetical protein
MDASTSKRTRSGSSNNGMPSGGGAEEPWGGGSTAVLPALGPSHCRCSFILLTAADPVSRTP